MRAPTTKDESDQPAALPLTTLLQIFLPFACGYFLSYVYRSVNAVISSRLVESLDLNATDLGLLTSVYFLTFALFQLPLGILLDRYGPRRVESVLLLFAAVGALLLSLCVTISGLILGRALIGLGVSACLMASFKAFTLWFPPERLPAVNGWIMASGALGALMATAPVEAALQIIDWRGLFVGLAVCTLVVAAVLFCVVPERPGHHAGGDLGEQLRGVVKVFSNGYFWRVVPLTVLSQASFLSIQGLWAGPWLKDVAGLAQADVANHLFFIAVAMMAGFLSLGNLTYRLSRFGIKPMLVAGTGMLCFMLTQLTIILGFIEFALPLWMLFGFFGSSGILTYAVLSQAFPIALAGRVNTAINLLVFILAFIGQWGIGAIINLWPVQNGSGYTLEGYQMGFGVALFLQTLAFAWLVLGLRSPSIKRKL